MTFGLKALICPCSVAYCLNPLFLSRALCNSSLKPSTPRTRNTIKKKKSDFELLVFLLFQYCNEQNTNCINIKVKWTITKNKVKLMEKEARQTESCCLHF